MSVLASACLSVPSGLPGAGPVAVVGSRSLAGPAAAAWVSGVVGAAVASGRPVWSGGALGADGLALAALLACGPAACASGVVWSAWPLASGLSRFPAPCRPALAAFLAAGGALRSGPWAALPPVAALAARTVALCSAAGLVVCCPAGPCPASLPRRAGGSWGSAAAAVRAGVPLAVLLPPGVVLPSALGGVLAAWSPVASGPLAGASLFGPGASAPRLF